MRKICPGCKKPIHLDNLGGFYGGKVYCNNIACLDDIPIRIIHVNEGEIKDEKSNKIQVNARNLNGRSERFF